MNVNILIPSENEDWFSRQLSDEIKSLHYIRCNSEEDTIWDIVVVYENLSKQTIIRCKKGGLLFLSGEPPLSNVYSTSFLRQFDCIVSAHKKLPHPNSVNWQTSLPWHLGLNHAIKGYTLNFNELVEYSPIKSKDISTICSFKKLMPGHARRNTMITSICQEFPFIDLFGKAYHYIDDKREAIDNYRFHICMENTSVDDYWSEKLADTILGLAVPIYIGCTNIERYFDSRAMIVCHNEEELKQAVEKVSLNPQEEYDKILPYLKKERNKILYKYNIFETIENINTQYMNIKDEVISFTLSPNQTFSDYKRKYYQLRFTRLILRYIK